MDDHGFFLTPSRVNPGVINTNQNCGYTMWHLLAAGMLSEYVAIEFLESTEDECLDVLIDDLREAMAVFPNRLRREWENNASYRLGENGTVSWSWSRFRRLTAWKTPLEICELVGRPLIACEIDPRRMHPVVVAAQRQSLTMAK